MYSTSIGHVFFRSFSLSIFGGSKRVRSIDSNLDLGSLVGLLVYISLMLSVPIFLYHASEVLVSTFYSKFYEKQTFLL